MLKIFVISLDDITCVIQYTDNYYFKMVKTKTIISDILDYEVVWLIT